MESSFTDVHALPSTLGVSIYGIKASVSMIFLRMTRGNGHWADHWQCLPRAEHVNKSIVEIYVAQETGTNGGCMCYLSASLECATSV